MDNELVFNTYSGNSYMYSMDKSKIMHTNPLLAFIILNNNKSNLNYLISQNPLFSNITPSEINYQLQKYEFLKNNGYFNKCTAFKQRNKRLSKESVLYNFSRLGSICFEVTEACNLNCTYCGYGELYGHYDKRENKKLDFIYAKSLIDYYHLFLNSTDDTYTENDSIMFNFYGGEPLLNFELIKGIVDYVKTLKFKGKSIEFAMTTNGLLLDKYIEFIANNDFYLTVSIDGDSFCSSYRLDHSGNNRFEDLYKNLKHIQRQYPDYFKDKIIFNSVLHNKNSYEEIYGFISKEFGKFPRISEMNDKGVAADKKDDYKQIYRNGFESFKSYESKDTSNMLPAVNNVFMDYTARGADSLGFTLKYDSVNSLFNESPKSLLTGSCTPFYRSVFLTANRKILYCEKVPHDKILGIIHEDGVVEFDFEKITSFHNNQYDGISNSCSTCYAINRCTHCTLADNELTFCSDYQTKEDMLNRLSNIVEYFEENPSNYIKSIQEITLI